MMKQTLLMVKFQLLIHLGAVPRLYPCLSEACLYKQPPHYDQTFRFNTTAKINFKDKY